MTKQIDWKAEIAAWRASGDSAREFCAGRGYPVGRLYWWSSQLKRAEQDETSKTVPLARVVRKKDSVETRVPRKPVVVHIGGARVEVVTDSDPTALKVVLEALAATSWGQS